MSRSPEEVSKLFAYTRWADARVLAPVKALTAEEFGRQLGGSFPSVRETLAHMYAADWVWLERWLGRSPKGLPSEQEVPTLDTLLGKWVSIEEGQKVFLAGLTEARMGEVVSYINVKGESWSYAIGDMLVHLVNHSTYHRGQVVTMLRQLGKAVQATDYLLFLDASKA